MLGRGHEPRTRQQHAYSEHFEALGGGLHKLFEALSTHTARQQTSEGMGSRSAPAYRPPRPLRGVGVGSYGAPLGLPNIHIQQQLRRKPSARRDRSRRDASIHLYGDLFRGLGCTHRHLCVYFTDDIHQPVPTETPKQVRYRAGFPTI